MTREEAILHMILRREELKQSVGDLDEDIKAFDMAIEALEQEPCKCFTCKYGEWKRKGWDMTMADDKCGGCCSWNDKYEPLEQEPKTGHWIKSSSWFECSECSLATDESGKNFYGYCPNCGCKMEG